MAIKHWAQIPDGEKPEFIASTFNLIVINHPAILSKHHFLTRYVILYTNLITVAYPEVWENAFVKLISFANESEKFVSLIVLVLEYFNDDIVEGSRVKRAESLQERARIIKDHMRQNDVAQVI
jgi:hypothetical protein